MEARSRLGVLSFVLGALVTGAAVPPAEAAAPPSAVAELLGRLAGETWVYRGTSRHGEDTEMVSSWEAAADGRGFVGRGEVRQGGATTASSALYSFHPRRGLWTYTSISANGTVQEAEEMESSATHVVFKGTAYRTDGTQTTFVWSLTLEEDGYLSESMAFHQGEWRNNPPTRFVRRTSPESPGFGR